MRNVTTALMLAAALVSAACTQMPTEKHGISDMRPQIAFKAASVHARAARVLVDEADVGAVSDYIDGSAAVRVLPGTHVLRVVADGDVLIEEKIYLGDGVSRTFILK